jgi:uncharacterized membrane protein
MSTIAAGYSTNRRVTASTILRWIAGSILAGFGLIAYVIAAGHYATYAEPAYGNYWPERGWLIAHIAGGTVALFLGPFQLFSGLRRRSLRYHRLLGKLYLGGVAVGSVAAFYLACTTSPLVSMTFSIGLFLLGVAWSSSTAMAFLAIRNRNIDVHKEWMIRSYVVTYAFVTFRVWLDLPVFHSIAMPERLGLMSWMCWALPLLLTELALQWKRTVGKGVRTR